MKKLNLRAIKAAALLETCVAVAEFGEGMEVNVRGLTVRDKSVLGMQMQAYGVNDVSAGAVIAALCARDDAGDLVFGKDRAEAIKTVSDLPEKYYPAIMRISKAAIELSAVSGPSLTESVGGVVGTAGEMVSAAEKN